MTKNSTPRPTPEAPPEMPDFDDGKVVEVLRQTAENPKHSEEREMARDFLKKYAPSSK